MKAAALRATLLATLLALAACTGNAPIPSGAQQVQVTVTDSGVVLQPESVPAGDVYLVLDDGSISFVERKAGAYGTSEPLSEEQIAQIGDGNLQDTSVSGLEANNCDSEQNAAARGMTGPVWQRDAGEGAAGQLPDRRGRAGGGRSAVRGPDRHPVRTR